MIIYFVFTNSATNQDEKFSGLTSHTEGSVGVYFLWFGIGADISPSSATSRYFKVK